MTTERWREIKAIFNSALERPAAERASYLDAACGSDGALRREVESLLASHREAADFIESPVLRTDTLFPPAEEEAPEIGRRIGAYRTVEEIGRGGMGSVYLAVRDDDEFQKRVAIKLIRRGMEMDFIIRRFRNERQILANLDHPYIARLLDGGTTEDGLPYFVMEHVEGRPIHHYCEEHRLSVAERLQLFVKACSAVEYAHQHQVVHRDLKPGNILVTTEGLPKLLDFGIAKLLEAPDAAPRPAEPTTGGFRMMTPAYASPEQMRGEPATAASDVYSLGVMLYELLTGRRPEQWRGAPDPASALAQLDAGIDSILALATRDRPAERYASVAKLSEDIERHLAGTRTPVAPSSVVRGVRDPDTEYSTGVKTIAVLPFQPLGGEDKTDEYLGVGMADSLITKLSNIRRIVVRPTSIVLKYARGEHDLVAVARDLDVRYVLDGRIRRVGDRVRVTVQLIRGTDGATLWAVKFDEKFTDILNLEDSLSEQVAQALIVRLTQEERDLLHKRGTENAQAYQAYLKGRYHWASHTEDGLSKAIVSFMEALALDPRYAQAQTGVADYHNWLGVWNVLPPDECFAAAKDAAHKALELDPSLADAHASLGFAGWAHDRDWAGGERAFRRAIELNPDYAPTFQWYAYLASAQGRHDEAISHIERAVAIEPASPILWASAGFVYHNARRYERGREALLQALRINPNYFIAQTGVAWVSWRMHEHVESIAAARKALAMMPGDPLLLWTLASALANAGQASEAREVLRQMIELSAVRYVSPYYIAVVHADLGEADAALEWLGKAYERRDWWLMFLAVEPRLDALRHDSRFQEMVERIGLAAAVPVPEISRPQSTPSLTALPATGWRKARPWIYALAALVVLLAGAAILKIAVFPTARPLANLQVVKLTNNGNATSAAISPDGRYVAYTLDEGGKQSVWIRQKAVASSQGIVPPAELLYRGLLFSHDGAYLYYVACERNDQPHGALYQVPILGGPRKKLTENVGSAVTLAPGGGRGTFLRTNQAGGRDELIVADLERGGERVLTSRKHPDRFAYASAPAWSPDGKTIVVAVNGSEERGSASLIAVDAGSGREHPFSPQRWQFVERMVWLADGSGVLIVGQDPGATFQQIWEVRAAGGRVRKITNDLNDYIGVSLSANSRELVTVQFQILANLWVAPEGDANRAKQITSGAGRYYDLAWTPDGKLLYSSDASDTVDIWIRDANGLGSRQLTSGARRNYAANSSPDGRYIVFHSNRTGSWNVWRMDADGGNPRPLTADIEVESNWPQVTLDGQWVVFHRPVPGLLPLWKMPIEGGQAVRITEGTCMRPAISPVGGMIACWYSEDRVKPHWSIGVLTSDGGKPVKTFEFPASVSVDSSLRWAPDGRAITYLDDRGGASNIWSQPVDGSPPRPLTTFKSAQLFSLAWSRNGRLAYSRGMMASDVVLFRQAE